MIDDVLELMLKSDMHRDWYVADLERLIVPAIKNDRLLVMKDDTRPTGLFSYTFLNREQEAGYKDGSLKLTPQVWDNGPRGGLLYVIDFIAPYNNALHLASLGRKALEDPCLANKHY